MLNRNKRFTVFSIKSDAIKRNLTSKLIKDLYIHFEIIDSKKIYVNKKIVNILKKWDWEHNWVPYPSNAIKRLSYANETGKTIFLLCKARKNVDAIKFGDKLKGSSHNPFISNKESLRSKYKDKSLKNRVHINEFKIGILYDLNNKPRSLVPNVIHAVDSEEELRIHIRLFFNKYYSTLFKERFNLKVVNNIIKKTKKLKLKDMEYVIFAGSTLAIRNIRESKDIDILVSPSLYKALLERRYKNRIRNNTNLISVNGMEIFDSIKNNNYNPNLKQIIKNANWFKGVPFASLKETLRWKLSKKLTPKVKRDINLINKYLLELV